MSSSGSRLLIVVLAVAAGAMGMAMLQRSRAPRSEAPTVTAASPTAPPTPAPPSPVAKTPAETLTVEQIAKGALPSVVSLQCGDRLGAGFFVAEDLVVTNAHVTCADQKMMKVRLNDGREVLGVVKTRDAWVDVATVEVVASNVPPLRIGDPLELTAGARLVAVGSPKGLEFSVSDGTTSFVGRNLYGVGYVQFNAPINPGNSGGPLLDASGAAVGIVTLKRTDAEGIAFALPIWYARPPEDPVVFARWNDFLRKVKETDAEERATVLAKLAHPVLLDLQVRRDGLNAVFGQSRNERPQPGRVELQIEQGDEQCLARGSVERWIQLDELARDAEEMPRRMEWLVRSGDAKNLYYALTPLDLRACRLSERPATVRFESGEPITVSGTALVAASNASRNNDARKSAVDDAVNDLRAEQWRSAFRAANARVDAAKAALAAALSHAGSAGTDDERSAWQSRAGAAEALVRDAERQLADLERRASNASVPREWRH